jgi:vacuolar-type H+-ATPase subunit F/Vma7
MSQIAAIGAETRIRGYALAGVLLLPAETADEVREAWRQLPADVAVVMLTEAAAADLDRPDPPAGPPFLAVMG